MTKYIPMKCLKGKPHRPKTAIFDLENSDTMGERMGRMETDFVVIP
jgi:hypothetical protein